MYADTVINFAKITTYIHIHTTYTYYIHILHTHTTYRISDHIVSFWTTFRRDKNGRNKSITGTSFISRNTATDQGHSHTLNLGCAREELFLIRLLYSPHFSSIFPHFVPQIGPWRGKFTHLGRPCLRHCNWYHWSLSGDWSFGQGPVYATVTDTIGRQVTGPLEKALPTPLQLTPLVFVRWLVLWKRSCLCHCNWYHWSLSGDWSFGLVTRDNVAVF